MNPGAQRAAPHEPKLLHSGTHGGQAFVQRCFCYLKAVRTEHMTRVRRRLLSCGNGNGGGSSRRNHTGCGGGGLPHTVPVTRGRSLGTVFLDAGGCKLRSAGARNTEGTASTVIFLDSGAAVGGGSTTQVGGRRPAHAPSNHVTVGLANLVDIL